MADYGNITKKYKLPSIGLGEIISPDEEQRRMQIIDNNLYGAIRAHSGGHGVIRNGDWTLIEGTGTYSALLSEVKSQGRPTIEAFINQIYCFQETTLEWSGLSNTTTHYLYARLVETTSASSLKEMKVQTASNTTGVIPSDGILVAVLLLNEPGNSSFVEDPTEKINIPIWGNHIVNNQNPHTPYLLQDDIVLSGMEILDFLRYRNLQVQNLTISGNAIISGNITVLGRLILSGNVIVQGNIRYNLLQVENLTVPGQFLVSDLYVSSGIEVYARSTFRRDIQLMSGITVDGFDPSQAIPLIDGSNADHLHGHVLGSLAVGVKAMYCAPEYPNSIVSGHTNSGVYGMKRLYNKSFYEWFAVSGGIAISPITRMNLPQDFERIDRISVMNAVGLDGVLSGNNIQVQVFDKDFTQLQSTPSQLQNTQVVTSDVTVSGGNLVPGTPLTIINRMAGYSGIPTMLGDLTLWYVPKQGEKIVFDWNSSVSGSGAISAQKHFDGLRLAPATLRIEKILTSQTVGLSGVSVIDINVGNMGAEPSTIFTSTAKPIIYFNTSGAQYQSNTLIPTQNLTITQGQLISASSDSIASGSRDVSVQLVTFRI